MPSAFIQVPKDNGDPRLALPAGVTLENLGGGLRRVIYDPDGDGVGPSGFFKILLSDPTQWIAWFSGPRKGIDWLSANLQGGEVVAAAIAVRDYRNFLENTLGLTFDGNGRMLAPHVIAGQSPWIAPAP